MAEPYASFENEPSESYGEEKSEGEPSQKSVYDEEDESSSYSDDEELEGRSFPDDAADASAQEHPQTVLGDSSHEEGLSTHPSNHGEEKEEEPLWSSHDEGHQQYEGQLDDESTLPRSTPPEKDEVESDPPQFSNPGQVDDEMNPFELISTLIHQQQQQQDTSQLPEVEDDRSKDDYNEYNDDELEGEGEGDYYHPHNDDLPYDDGAEIYADDDDEAVDGYYDDQGIYYQYVSRAPNDDGCYDEEGTQETYLVQDTEATRETYPVQLQQRILYKQQLQLQQQQRVLYEQQQEIAMNNRKMMIAQHQQLSIQQEQQQRKVMSQRSNSSAGGNESSGDGSTSRSSNNLKSRESLPTTGSLESTARLLRSPLYWASLVCCFMLLVLVIVGAVVLLNKNDDNSANSANNSGDFGNNNRNTINKTQAPELSPTVSTSPPSPTKAHSDSVKVTVDVMLDLIGATDLMNEQSNATLSESCALFFSDQVIFDATRNLECNVLSQELIVRDRPTRRLGRSLQLDLNTTTVPALQVQLRVMGDSDSDKVIDRSALEGIVNNKLMANDFLIILTNTRDSAFESVEQIVVSDDASSTATLTPAPTARSGSSATPAPTTTILAETPTTILASPSASPFSPNTTLSSASPVSPYTTLSPTSSSQSAILTTALPTTGTVSIGTGTPTALANETAAPSMSSSGGSVLLPGETAAPTAASEVRDKIVLAVGNDRFATTENPYNEALNWMTGADPMNLTASSPNLIQRYTAAYLYFATSKTREWASCGPAKDDGDDPVNCVYHKVVSVDPFQTSDEAATRWLSNVSECDWVGLLCDDLEQVRAIELVGMNMTGWFPGGVQFFPLLQSLTLAIGQLQGSIPSEALSQMTSLVNINLQYNELNGPFPTVGFVSLADKIENIILTDNNFAGSLSGDISKLTNLSALTLSGNAMTGEIPNTIGDLSNLKDLRLNGNYFVGQIPSAIGNLQAAEFLWMHGNQLNGTIPASLSNMTALLELRAFGNQLTGAIPESLFDLTKLSRLELDSNMLTGTLSTKIGLMTGLQTLYVSANDLTGILPTELGQLVSLNSAWFYANDFVGDVPGEACLLRSSPTATLTELVADCSVDSATNLAEIQCPAGCCTMCCDANGQSCFVST